jgi:RHS repeat-associated protein
MAEQLGSNYYNTPYKFNGKELDEETGLYYYGARYYDPRLSILLSVDPLAEEFPDTSPYVYVSNNPLNLIDPTGMSEEKADGKGVKDPPIGLEQKDGTAHKDNTGSWLYNKTENIWKGQEGSKDIENSIQLKEVVVQGKSNKRDTGDFNIDKAINTLNKNALNESSGKCAKYIRWALESGGVNTIGHPISAKDYDTFLTKKGFDAINTNNYLPQRGDISVMESFIGTKKSHPDGHIQMFSGKQWISDFKQNGFWPGSDYRKHKPIYTILRK